MLESRIFKLGLLEISTYSMSSIQCIDSVLEYAIASNSCTVAGIILYQHANGIGWILSLCYNNIVSGSREYDQSYYDSSTYPQCISSVFSISISAATSNVFTVYLTNCSFVN